MIEIIPKPAVTRPLWLSFLFFISISLLLASIGSCFLLDHYFKKSKTELENLEEILIQGKSPEETKLEEDILNYRKKIDDFSLLFDSRGLSARAFVFLEKLSHPKIWFSKIILNPPESSVWISGETQTFQTLGQQLLIFQKEPFIKNVSLSKISMERGGEVGFVFDLLISPQVFK